VELEQVLELELGLELEQTEQHKRVRDLRCACVQSDEFGPSDRAGTKLRISWNQIKILIENKENKLDFYEVNYFFELKGLLENESLIRPFLSRFASYSQHSFDTTSVTPGFEKNTRCITYVRQDQVSHIWKTSSVNISKTMFNNVNKRK